MKGWLDKYGKEINANEGHSSASKDWIGEGYSNVGRNYSPAWGGQFQMGGSLPGAVGFTYARTAGSAPSNGPYAKKTKASAQDGLTFLEPNSSKLPQGYMEDSDVPSTERAMSIGGEDGEPAYLIPSFKYGKPILGPSDSPYAEFERTGEHLGGPFKTWQEADEWEKNIRHPYVEKGQSIPTPLRRWGKDFENGGSMSYYQHGLDWKPKSISKNGDDIPKNQNAQFILPNPRDLQRQMMNKSDVTVTSIQEKQKQDAIAQEVQRRNEATAKRQFISQGKKSTPESEARRVMLNKQYTAGLPNVQMDQFGNTFSINPNMTYTGEPANFIGERQQKSLDHVVGALEAASYVMPVLEGVGAGYSTLKKGISTLPNPKTIALSKMLDNSKLNTKLANNLYANRILEEELIAPNVSFKGLEPNLPEGSRIINHAGSSFLQKDGRMYYIQEHNDRIRLLDNTDYFVPHPEDLHPSKSKLKDLKKYNISDKSDPIYDNQWYHFNQTSDPIDDWIIHNDLGGIKGEKTWWKKSEPYKGMTNRSLFDQPQGRHIYAKQSALESSLGRPLDEHRELIGDVVKKGNVQRGGLTITPTGESLLPNIQEVKSFTYNPLTKSMERGIFKKKEGGVIEDDRGQWAHPGKITKINSNQITMKGVDYPVLGISDAGDQQMMYPDQEYTFKGKNVTEIPMAQNGLGGTRADSLILLNNSIAKDNFYKNNPEYFKSKSSIDFKNPKVLRDLAKSAIDKKNILNRVYNSANDSEFITKPSGKNYAITIGDIKRKLGKVKGSSDIYSAPDIFTSSDIDTYFNPASPPIFFSPSILPQGSRTYSSTKKSDRGDISESPYYDPLAITPWDMLKPEQQKERLKKYGKSGTPYANPNYKPQSDSSSKSKPIVQTTQKQKPKSGGWIPLTPELAKGRYSGNLKNMYYHPHRSTTGEGAISYFAPPEKKVEPVLKKKVSNIKLINTPDNSFTPGVTSIQHPEIIIPNVKGKYRVEYYDPELKSETHRMFPTQEASDAFAEEILKRGLYGSPITQRVEYVNGGITKKSKGWLEKYN